MVTLSQVLSRDWLAALGKGKANFRPLVQNNEAVRRTAVDA